MFSKYSIIPHHLLSFTKAVKLPTALLNCPRDGDLAATCLSSSCKDFTGHLSACTAEPYQSEDVRHPEVGEEARAGHLSLGSGPAVPSSGAILPVGQARPHLSASQEEAMDETVGKVLNGEAGGSFPFCR